MLTQGEVFQVNLFCVSHAKNPPDGFVVNTWKDKIYTAHGQTSNCAIIAVYWALVCFETDNQGIPWWHMSPALAINFGNSQLWMFFSGLGLTLT